MMRLTGPNSTGEPGQRSRKPQGIHTIEIYWPQFYFTQVDMEDPDLQQIDTSIDTL